MMLLKNILILLFLTAGYCKGLAQTDPYQNDLRELQVLSLNNINISSTQDNDSIIALCRNLEPQARKRKDYANQFLIGHIWVNASCQNGEIATAITKAKQMYDEAERKNSPEGIVLSLQAFGSTYLHSGQYKEALASFVEAQKEAQHMNVKNELLYLRLTMQQFYTCLALRAPEEAAIHLNELLKSPFQKENPLLAAQTLYYQAALSLSARKDPDAEKYLNRVSSEYGAPKGLKMLHQMIWSQYYIAISDYAKAYSIIDSLTKSPSVSKNNTGYRNILWLRARIVALSGEYDRACRFYEEMKQFNNSLNASRYTSSIDTLRAAHQTNQLKLENARVHNRFIIQAISPIIILILVAAILFSLLRRKNQHIRKTKERLSQATEAATQSIHTKSLFLSNMSHDLRTPLNAIVGFSNLLAENEEVDDETKVMCRDYIQQNSELLLKLFNDILDLSALNENKMQFTFAPCNITVLSKNTVDSVIQSLRNSDNTLLFEPHVGDLTVNTDSGRLQQVLINLLVNATKFTQAGTIRLILKVDESAQKAIFIIEDTGCGIPLDKQPGIFERFEKLNEQKQGAGLGLSICKLIVDRFGGEIWIDPEYTQGARFIFTHPLDIKEESC